jgi:hypothetical protein
MHIPLYLIRTCHCQAKDKLRRDIHVLEEGVGCVHVYHVLACWRADVSSSSTSTFGVRYSLFDIHAFSQDLIIKSADPATLTLRDMSEQFELTIELREGSQYAFGISCSKFQLERGTTHLDFATVIDQEVFSGIAEGFNNFPRWWQI